MSASQPLEPRPPLAAALLRLLAGAAAALLLAACATPAPDSVRSAKRGGVTVDRGLVYAQRPSGPLRADVYRPGAGRHPGVVVLHPGGWVSGHRRDVARQAMQLARAGYVAVAVSYRLAPEHVHPAQIHDVKEAVRWLRVHADEFGVDPERIAAFGYSSGGHLASLLATSGPGDGLEGETAFPGVSSRVQALVAGGTPSDLEAMPSLAISRFLGGPRSEHEARAASASPIRFVSADDPPSFLYHGRFDLLISSGHAKRMFEALQRQGVPAKLSFNRMGHFSTWLAGRTQEQRAIAFLDRWIGRDAGAVATRSDVEPTS